MKLTKGDISLLTKQCKSAEGKWDSSSNLTLLRFAIKDLHDRLFKEYNVYTVETNDMLFRYVEIVNGIPQFKKQIIDIKKPNEPEKKEFLFKSDEAKEQYEKEYAEYLKKEVEVELRTYPFEKLLETPVSSKSAGDDVYVILKYIGV